MKKFGVINYCDDASCIPGLVGDLKDTPEEGMAEALRTAESYCDDEGCSKELIETGSIPWTTADAPTASTWSRLTSTFPTCRNSRCCS